MCHNSGMNRAEAGRLGAIKTIPIIRQRVAERRALYDSAPRRCVRCNEPLPYGSEKSRKFCGHPCAALFSNKGRVGRRRTIKRCTECGKKTWMTGLLCRDHQRYADFIGGKLTQRQTLKKFLIERDGRKCTRCGREEWENDLIPLEVDHMDGNPGNDLPQNLRLLCPNCHALAPTSKGRNRGNGRKARGIRR